MQIENESLNDGDILAINALVEILAAQKGFHRENSYFLIEQEFKVSSISHLKRTEVDRALAFLADLQDLTIH